ncbi:cation diffusion facilitator family transporter [Curtobacterium ammoniigenes]|uniref:cation diffusion facilitator family transporter n=1 Tax=Curtobacterium ammoniigenes TaxID=395387 RepID=UPI00082E69DF|nr:cation diffusion facilitator family transporter [Curtobacterium ammoniigenes]
MADHPSSRSNSNAPTAAHLRTTQARRLTAVLLLNVGLIVGLTIAGQVAHSVGVLAAAGDAVADTLALLLGLVAVRIRDRSTAESARKAIPAAALVNATLLACVTVAVAWESANRLMRGSPDIHGLPMVLAACITVVVMLSSALILGRSAASEDLHMRSVLLDALADAAAAGGVAVAGGIILVTGRWLWLDPVVALALAALIALPAVRLIIKAARALRGAEVDFDDD